MAEAFAECVGDAWRSKDVVQIELKMPTISGDGEIRKDSKQSLHNLSALFKAAELAEARRAIAQRDGRVWEVP